MVAANPAPVEPPPASGLSRLGDWVRHPSLGSARSLYRWALIGITVGVIAGVAPDAPVRFLSLERVRP